MLKNIAFIPARGGSKSIPGKNIKPIAGKPLIQWTIEACCNANYIDKVFVSTDSVEIRDFVVSLNIDSLVVVGRSPETATDTASTESVLLEFVQQYDFDSVALVQATSPLLESRFLDEGFKKHNDNAFASVISVVEQKRFIWEKNGDAGIIPTNYNPLKRPRRQDFNGFLVENGAFYISSRQSILNSRNRFDGEVFPVMMPEESYFEIDEESDWIIVEDLLKRKEKKNIQSDELDIKLVISDVDGVLTDAGMYYSEYGDELKKFNTHDGMAFQLLKEKGYKTAIITSELTKIVKRRADKLNVDFLYQGKKNGGKLNAAKEICDELGIKLSNVAYVGDDLNCMELLSHVGLAACPENAVDRIKNIQGITILRKKGGEGVFREFCELFFLNDL